MLQKFSRRAALLLLPVIVQAFVLPKEIVDIDSKSGASRYSFNSPVYGGPSTFFEYDIRDQSVKFSIPCPDCSDEEKELLKREIISVKPTAQNTKHCTSTDPIGLEIDNEQVISTGESNLSLQSHVGPLDLTQHSKHHIFNRTRWINHCGCTKRHLEDEECDGDFESSFSFEVLGLSSGQIPGFTLSYRQYGIPELLRFSTFPDIGIADSWRFGQSAHYKSPLLRLQKGINPTSTTISTSSFFSPSSTATASSPSYTYFEKTPTKSTEAASPLPPIPSEAGVSSQSSNSDSKTPDPVSAGHSDHHGSQWCHIPNVLAAVGHGIEAISMNAKSRAQAVLGKVDETVKHTRLSSISSLPSNKKSPYKATGHVEDIHYELDDGFVDDDSPLPSDHTKNPHDELDDPVIVDALNEESEQSPNKDATVKLASVEDFDYVDLATNPWLFNNPTTVKAFQVTSLVFIIAALSGSLFALARRNPRLRAKWAAMLEEHNNQRLYRHAARKQKCQKFFSRFRSSCPLEKNKSSPFIQHEDVLGWQEWEKRQSEPPPRYDQDIDAQTLKRDLLAFRKAHQFVDGIIAAEEGRPSNSRRGHQFTHHRIRHQRTWSFGSEKTAPPAYESDGEDVILDADVPRFVAIRRGMAAAGISPDSSVVSTSPRSSCVDSDSEREDKF